MQEELIVQCGHGECNGSLDLAKEDTCPNCGISHFELTEEEKSQHLKNQQSEYTIYQQEYIDAIKEQYDSSIAEMVDGSSNFIHPSAIVGKNVKLGNRNYIGANCYIVGDTIIGDNNHFEAFCSVGSFPEHRAYFNNKKMQGVVIGDNNVFREFTTINSGCIKDTIIGNNVWMLKGSHVGHDSEIMDGTTLSCNVLIGGHSLVGYDVNFGLGSICHQFSVIGSCSMIGMGTIINKKSEILPYKTYVGNPPKILGVNAHKIYKYTFTGMGVHEDFYKMQLQRMEKIKKDLL